MADTRDQKIFAWRSEGKTFAWIAQQLGISRPMVAHLYYRQPGAVGTRQVRDGLRGFSQMNQLLRDYATAARGHARRLVTELAVFDSPAVMSASEWGFRTGYPTEVVASIAEGTRSIEVVDAAREAREAFIDWKSAIVMHPLLPGEWLEDQARWCDYVPAIVLRRRRSRGLRCAPSKDGTRLRAHLDRAGLKVNDMAEKFNVRPCYVSQWLSGCSPIPKRVLEVLNEEGSW